MTGKDLKLGREQKGWTQEAAANRLSVSQLYLSLMEKEPDQCPTNWLAKLLPHLDCLRQILKQIDLMKLNTGGS